MGGWPLSRAEGVAVLVLEFLWPEDLRCLLEALRSSSWRSGVVRAAAVLAQELSHLRRLAAHGALTDFGESLSEEGVACALAPAFRRTGVAVSRVGLGFLAEHLYVRLRSALSENNPFLARLDEERKLTPGLKAVWSDLLEGNIYTRHGEMCALAVAGSVVVSGTSEGTLLFNDVQSGKFARDGALQLCPGHPVELLKTVSPWMVAVSWEHGLALVRVGELFDDEDRFIAAEDHMDSRAILLNAGPICDGSEKVTAMNVTQHSGCLVTGWTDGVVRIFDASDGSWIGACTGHERTSITAICPLQDSVRGADFATGSRDASIILWQSKIAPCSVQRDRIRGCMIGHFADICDLSTIRSPADGRELLISGSKDFTVRVWDPRKRSLLRTCGGHGNAVVSVFGMPDGRILSSSWDRQWILFDTYGNIKAKYGHKRGVQLVAPARKSKAIISVSSDNVIHLVRKHDAKPISVWANPNRICNIEIFCPNRGNMAGQELAVIGCRNGRLGVFSIVM